jgi:hypothetical protein
LNSPKPKYKIFLLTLLIVGVIGAAVITATTAYDTYRDRQHTLIITGQLLIFKNPEIQGKMVNPVIAILNKGDRVRVQRIWYGKDYMVVKVRLIDGSEGYLISGESGNNFTLSERY